jgi:hypothetical protein
MQTEETYDDLTALFEAQDETLQSDAFVDRVMQPIHKRARWRGPLLFGAGGLGVGAAVSQIGGLMEALNGRVTALNLSFNQFQTPSVDIMAADTMWIAATLIVVVSCAAIVVTERA